VADLRLMKAMLYAVHAYLFVRLIVGIFGMDLYEIYWWFAMGIIIAVHNMSKVAARLTALHLQQTETALNPPAGAVSSLHKLPAR
jgi:hypothetical protein